MRTEPGRRSKADEPLAVARRAAERYAAAVGDTQRFADRLDGDPDPADVAEYAALVAREEAARAQRQEAFLTLGFTIDSLEEA